MSAADELNRWDGRRAQKRKEAGLPDIIDASKYPDDVKAAAIEALNAAHRLGMLRVGNPWVPIADAMMKTGKPAALCRDCDVAQVLRQLLRHREDALRAISEIKAAVEISSSDDEAINEYSSKLGLARDMARGALPITR